MRIIFFGSPASAIFSLKKILEEGHDVPLIVTQADKPSGRGRKLVSSPVKKFAQQSHIPVLQPERIKKDAAAFERIKEINPDLLVVHGYGQIIPGNIIFFPKHNSVNVHFSLLPKYRGASPVQWAILNGEEKTGVTVFELNEKMDEGNILAQQEIEIYPREKASELEIRMAVIGAEILAKTIACIAEIEPRKQDHSNATYAPKIKKEDGRIDWTKSALSVDRLVRAFFPWPSAFSFLMEKRIKVIEGFEAPVKISSYTPGEVLEIEKQGITVGCGDQSAFTIQKLQPENRSEMTAYSFALGSRIERGARFS